MDKANFILTIISLFLALVSLVAIVLSFISYRESTKTNLRVNSKEYHIYEDLKYSLLQVIASVRSIDAKAAVAIDIEEETGESYNPDYLLEIDIITKLQSSPGYLIFLNSIKDANARLSIESIFRNMSMKLNSFSNTFTRGAAHLMMKYIEENLNPKVINNKELYNLMLDLCEMEGVFTNLDYEKLVIDVDNDVKFIAYLSEKGIDDPEINTMNMKEIISRYHDYYEEFMKSKGG